MGKLKAYNSRGKLQDFDLCYIRLKTLLCLGIKVNTVCAKIHLANNYPFKWHRLIIFLIIFVVFV